MPIFRTSLMVLCSLLFISCGPAEPEDFDRDCNEDSDCIVAFLSRDCDCEVVTAINKRDAQNVKESNDDESSWEWCPGGQVACDIAPVEAYCKAGTCAVRPQSND